MENVFTIPKFLQGDCHDPSREPTTKTIGPPKKQTDTYTKLEENPACVEIAAVDEKRSFAKTHS